MSTSGIPGPEKFGSDGAGFLGEFIMAIFLLLALSHNIFFSLNKRESFKKLISDKEIRLGLFTVVFVTIVLSLKCMSLISPELNLDGSIVNGLKLVWGNFFTSFSFMTTTGYISSYWVGPSSTLDMPHITIVLLGLCLFGGGLATTAGGIKLLRIAILFSAFSNETGKLLNPSSMAGTNINLKRLEISVFMAWVFFMLFIVSLASVTIILGMLGLLFEDAIVLAVACLTTTGPIIEAVGINSSLISELSNFSKLILVVSMVLGRLEILVALSVVTSALRRS